MFPGRPLAYIPAADRRATRTAQISPARNEETQRGKQQAEDRKPHSGLYSQQQHPCRQAVSQVVLQRRVNLVSPAFCPWQLSQATQLPIQLSLPCKWPQAMLRSKAIPLHRCLRRSAPALPPAGYPLGALSLSYGKQPGRLSSRTWQLPHEIATLRKNACC